MIENLGIEAGIRQEATPMREKLVCSAVVRLEGIASDFTKTAEVLRETFAAVIVNEPPRVEAKGEATLPHSGSEHGQILMDLAARLEESLTRITAIIGSVDI